MQTNIPPKSTPSTCEGFCSYPNQLVQASDNNLWGLSINGGISPNRPGTVFALTLAGKFLTSTEKTMYSFGFCNAVFKYLPKLFDFLRSRHDDDLKKRYYVTPDCHRGSEAEMSNHAVALKVTPCVRIECKFWLGDDGWNGTSEHPPITVQAGSFEHAKCDMEVALGKHIEELLTGGRQAKRQAA